MVNMSENEKMNEFEAEQVAGGTSLADARLDSYLSKYRSGPYKCPFCGKDYYLGDGQHNVNMCQKCWHDPDRLLKLMKSKND